MAHLDPGLISHDWIMKNVFGFSEKEIKHIHLSKEDERLRNQPPTPDVLAAVQLEKAIQEHDEAARPS